ncbi:hypothetical protein [Aeromonas caviae]|uniref:hypothetical protein n=1 Tax=Aeromonas caviae TaxID=648 RepID=UPI002AB56B98|nr:hypothetical protein [Aeromonas caviae]MDY7893071.1 hypothetical protein [Aeromonas caviae]
MFLEHYFKTLVELNDPQLSAGSKTREQEVCSATRLVFDDRNQDFKTLLNHLVPTDLDSVKKLAFQVELFCKNQQIRIETKNRNYLRAYVHFLLGNWGVGPGPTHDHSLHKLIKSRSVERLQVRF